MINDCRAAILKVISVYGKGLGATIERLTRNETRHYTSGNFLKTYSAGMEAITDTFPFGWKQAEAFWNSHPEYKPTGIYEQVDNDSALSKSRGVRKFIKFPSVEASFMTVAEIIHLRGDNGGRWFSKNPAQVNKYNIVLSKINTHFV